MSEPLFFLAKRILLIEDANSSAMLVRSIFETGEAAEAAEVIHLSTLADGIAYVADHAHAPVDVVLLDLTLPDSDGLETLSRFRKVEQELPVVVLTGTSDEAVGTLAMKMGAQDFLIKDETYPRLLRRQTNYAVHRKRQERTLEEALTTAEEATRLKDKFVSLVAHDLRGPLGGIVGLAELLANAEENGLQAEELKELSTEIWMSGKRLLNVVEDLLDISRLQQGKITPYPEFLDAHYVVSASLQPLAQMAKGKEVTIVNQVAEGSRIYADATLFGQVMQNLISNAIKFSQPGGRVRVFTPDSHPTTVAVQDRGVGIPPEVLPKLFRLEEKVSTPGTAGERGTGFGMPFSHNIMEAHGGLLRAESRPGAGSTFFAELPAVRPRVMVVDDQSMVRSILTMHLSTLGVDVIAAGDGREALALLRGPQKPHLILLDIVMPEMDGFQLLEALQRDPATQAIPVIMVTGDDKIETREKALRMGAVDFTVKPVVVHDLIPRVRRVVG
ncbi:response regulator [Endothiovibrio diazotrophicus]